MVRSGLVGLRDEPFVSLSKTYQLPRVLINTQEVHPDKTEKNVD